MRVFKISGESVPVEHWALHKEEKKLIIGHVAVALESYVRDSQTVINITRNGKGECVMGLDGKAGYVADIEIPQREYEYINIEEEAPENEDDGGISEKKILTARVPVPLDISAVVLKLWPLPEKKQGA
jgi:hypothetical protein